MILPGPLRVRRDDVFSEREVTKLGVVGPQGHQTGAVGPQGHQTGAVGPQGHQTGAVGLRSVYTVCGPMCALQVAVVVSNGVPDPTSD